MMRNFGNRDTSRFLDTEAFDNGMKTITKREECHESTECRPNSAAHQQLFCSSQAPTLSAEGHAGSADQRRQGAAQLADESTAQRYSPLDKINKSNVKSLKLAYAVALAGTSAR